MSYFFKNKTAYEMRISDWSSDVCSSDLDHFDAESIWPKDPMFIGKTSADIEAVAAELGQIIEDRIKDVLDGPGIRSEERRVGKECVSPCRSRWSQFP